MFFRDRKLLKATQANDLDAFKICLDKNVSAKYVSLSLTHAVYYGHADIVKEIFNSPKSDLLTAENKNTALEHVDLDYGEKSSFEIIKLLIDHGADINTSCGHFKRSLLSMVAAAGFKETTQFLIDHGSCLDMKDDWGSTAWIRSSGEARECFPEYPAYLAKQQKDEKEKQLEEQKEQQKIDTQEALEKNGELWMPIKTAQVSYTENYEELNRSICEVFNFQTRQVLTIIENTDTNAESHSKEYFAQYADRNRLAQACDVANENGQNVDKDMILNLEMKMTNGHLGQKMKIKVAK